MGELQLLDTWVCKSTEAYKESRDFHGSLCQLKVVRPRLIQGIKTGNSGWRDMRANTLVIVMGLGAPVYRIAGYAAIKMFARARSRNVDSVSSRCRFSISKCSIGSQLRR